MAGETNKQGKSKKSRTRSARREVREPEPSRGRPVPSDKILGHLRAAKKEIDTLSGVTQRETREREKSKVRPPPASRSTFVQRPGEVERTRGDISAREDHTRATKSGLRPRTSRKTVIQGPGEIERGTIQLSQREARIREALARQGQMRPLPSLKAVIQRPGEIERGVPQLSLREARIKQALARPGQIRPLPSSPSLIQRPGEVMKGVTALSRRMVRSKEIERMRPLALTGDLVRKPGEPRKFQRTESSLISKPTVERIEPDYSLKDPEQEKGTSLKSLIWIALALGVINLILLGAYSMKTLAPQFALHDLKATQTELAKEVGDIKYKSSLRNITDTLFNARFLIDFNKDYKEAARELEKVKMGLSSLGSSLPPQKRTEMEAALKEVEAALAEVQKGPSSLQEKLTDISRRLKALD